MKIGILGGAFDPPHLGHVIVAQQIIEYMKLDQIWMMPVYSHPFDKKMATPHDRIQMTKLLESKTIKASDFEHTENQSSITVQTMRLLRDQYPDDTFYWCMGSDLLQDFYKWDEWEKLIHDFNIIVYPRGTGVIDLKKNVCKHFRCDPLPKNIHVFDHDDVVITNISSTLVRKKLQRKESVNHIVPDKIIEYIKKNDLYK